MAVFEILFVLFVLWNAWKLSGPLRRQAALLRSRRALWRAAALEFGLALEQPCRNTTVAAHRRLAPFRFSDDVHSELHHPEEGDRFLVFESVCSLFDLEEAGVMRAAVSLQDPSLRLPDFELRDRGRPKILDHFPGAEEVTLPGAEALVRRFVIRTGEPGRLAGAFSPEVIRTLAEVRNFQLCSMGGRLILIRELGGSTADVRAMIADATRVLQSFHTGRGA